MKSLRTFILVLLAVLLPLRGALAAAMTCPERAAPQAATVVAWHGLGAAGHGHDDMHAAHGPHGHDATLHQAGDEGATSGDTSGGEHSGTCKLCVSGCCVTPLASAPPAFARPLPADSVTFPALCAPVSAFQSEGQERPPRTI